ncbi:MAG: hypothetical protein A4S09_10770 [Proteobacteria bacterium SG_bin7]|nr:MAG: hypothetical protein A4S09_10770 [Proteobacteria bacterium SG_bin7]
MIPAVSEHTPNFLFVGRMGVSWASLRGASTSVESDCKMTLGVESEVFSLEEKAVILTKPDNKNIFISTVYSLWEGLASVGSAHQFKCPGIAEGREITSFWLNYCRCNCDA